MENMKGQTLKLKEDYTVVSIEDIGALLDVKKRCYYDVNESAYFILKLIDNGCFYEDVVPGLIAEFDVVEQTAQVDSDSFINELINMGLVDISEETAERMPAVQPKKMRKPYTSPELTCNEVGILVGEAATIG